jgi:hypothetical protein
MSNTQQAVMSAVSSVLSATPDVNVRQVHAVSSTSARVLVQVPLHACKDGDAPLMQAIASAFSNKLHPLEASFVEVGKNNSTRTMTGIVSVRPEVTPFVEGLAGFTAFASNMYMDDDEKIWALRDSEAGAMLVKTGSINSMDELNSLLTGVASNNILPQDHEFSPTLQAVASSRRSVGGGDYITFVGQTNEMEFGVVCSTICTEDDSPTGNLCVLGIEGTASTIINQDAIVQVHADVEGLIYPDAMEAVAGAKSNVSVEDIAAYYGRVFQRNPEYFNKFMARWKQHFA